MILINFMFDISSHIYCDITIYHDNTYKAMIIVQKLQNYDQVLVVMV